jgi:hypothetical protein
LGNFASQKPSSKRTGVGLVVHIIVRLDECSPEGIICTVVFAKKGNEILLWSSMYCIVAALVDTGFDIALLFTYGEEIS